MTPTFRVIDKHTGREYSEKNINTDGLMEMDLDQMFLGEDGTLVMADDCDRIAYQDGERFDVLIDGYVPIDCVLEIIDAYYKEITPDMDIRPYGVKTILSGISEDVKALQWGEQK